MNVKILVFFNCVETIRYFLIYSSHDRTLTWWISNGKFRWRMVSFQSPFKENEIWIICKVACFKQKANLTKYA